MFFDISAIFFSYDLLPADGLTSTSCGSKVYSHVMFGEESSSGSNHAFFALAATLSPPQFTAICGAAGYFTTSLASRLG